jgi:IS1 family transposase
MAIVLYLVAMACTDGNPSYAEVFGEDIDLKHVVTKSETCLMGSYNSVLRYYLARPHRRTRKSVPIIHKFAA